jgi:hypothetical protein
MQLIDPIVAFQSELAQIRRDIHAHPELCYEEQRTADVVAQKLAEWGIPVIRGLGKTGVVGIIRGGLGDGPPSACAPTWTRCRCRKSPASPARRHSGQDARLRP